MITGLYVIGEKSTEGPFSLHHIMGHTYVCYAKHEFILISPILILYVWPILGFPVCLRLTSHSNRDTFGSCHLPSVYLFVQSQYMWTLLSELLTCALMGTNFTNYSGIYNSSFIWSYSLHSLIFNKIYHTFVIDSLSQSALYPKILESLTVF